MDNIWEKCPDLQVIELDEQLLTTPSRKSQYQCKRPILCHRIDFNADTIPDDKKPPLMTPDHDVVSLERKAVEEVMEFELANTFKHDNFRPHQKDIINNVMNKRDTLVLMTTGGGKSLCYQLSAVLLPGVTLVITPLKSLMIDQVNKLSTLGIRAGCISGDNVETSVVYRDLWNTNPGMKLVYTSPESLSQSKKLRDVLQSLHRRQLLSLIAFDEAHCVVEWGHDFRPQYAKLTWLKNTYPSVPFLAFTASATTEVKQQMKFLLGLNDITEFVTPFNRHNLKYSVVPKTSGCVLKAANIIKDKFPNQCGIIYCLTKKNVDKVVTELRKNGMEVSPYHAGMTTEQRNLAYQNWINGNVKVMIATVAFGMGIDKPNVRFVFHYSMPRSLEAYYQETGRAGRDGEVSECILFYKVQDYIKLMTLSLGADQKSPFSLTMTDTSKIETMFKFSEARVECRRKLLLNYFDDPSKNNYCLENPTTACDNCQNKVKYNGIDASQEAKTCVSFVSNNPSKISLMQFSQVLKGLRNKWVVNSGFVNHGIHGLLSQWVIDDITGFLCHLLVVDCLKLKYYRNANGYVNSSLIPGEDALEINSHLFKIIYSVHKKSTIYKPGEAIVEDMIEEEISDDDDEYELSQDFVPKKMRIL